MDKKKQQQNQTQGNAYSQIEKSLREDILSYRNYYAVKIKKIEDTFKTDKEIVDSFEFDPEKKNNAKKCLRKMKKCLKEIQKADADVQKNVNLLLDFKAQGELTKEILQNYNASCDAIQNNSLFDSFPIEIIDFPRKHKGQENWFFKRKVSAFYQLYVYQLVHSLLVLQNTMASFMFYQNDIIWILETNPKKKITFLTNLLSQQLSREDCFDCIKKVLNKNGLCAPEWAIKKQLSNWNKYLSTHGKEGSKPIYLYDFFRERSEELFEEWAENRYLPEFKNRHHKIVKPR